METLSAQNISLSLQRSLGPNVNDGPFIVMMVDDEPYIMLIVKRSIMAAKMVDALKQDLGITKAMIGMAFDDRESIVQSKLVLCPDPTVNGVYIPFADFKGAVRQMLGQ